MGIVYRARQRGLNRVVALKMVLARQLAGPEAVARFRAEAELAAQLQHPAIVAIHEVGEHEGEPFFSMDLVEGPSLAEMVNERRLPARDAAICVKTVAEAVHYAHQHGVLHRDLKPSNILIDASGQPRITDFGLAKRLTEDSDLTLTGQVLGSPNYAAPEQVMGMRHRIGPATDVYSLGAVLYHLLVRRPPFVAESLGVTLRLVQEADPLPPRSLNPSVPADLETIALKCLEKEPIRRYASAAEVASELGHFLQGEPIAARPPGTLGRMTRWCRRKPVLAGLVASLSLLALVVLIGSPIAAFRIERARRALEQEAYRSSIGLAKNYVDQSSIDQAMSILTNCPPAYRHWEWGHLVWLCHQEICSLQAFPPPSRLTHSRFQLEFGPSGGLLYSLIKAGTLQLWHYPSQQEVQRWGTPTNQVLHAVFDSAGERLAIGFANGTIEVWQLPLQPARATPSRAAPGTLLCRLAADRAVERLRWNRQGDRLLSGGDGRAQLWNMESRRVELDLGEAPDDLLDLRFDPTEERVLAWNFSLFRAWDRQSGHRIRTFGLNAAAGQVGLEAGPDGSQVIVGHADGLISVVTTNGARPLIVAPDLNEAGSPQRGVFSADGRLVCTTGEPGRARVWEIREVRERFVIPLRVRQARFSPDGRLLATCGGYNFAAIWDVRTGRELRRLRGHQGMLDEVDFSPDSRLVATMDQRGTIKVWTADPGRTELEHSNMVSSVAFRPDGRQLATGEDHLGLRVWAPESGQLLARIKGTGERTYGMAFSSDGTTLAAVGTGRLVRLFEVGPWKLLRSWEAADRWIPRTSFGGDGTCLFTYSLDGALRLWDPATGQLRREIATGFGTSLPSAAMSGDGRWVAAADGQGRVTLWEAATGEPLTVLHGHSSEVNSIAFTADDTRLATCSSDGVSRIWDLTDLSPAVAWTARGCDWPVGFSRDGQRLFAGTIRYDAPAYDEPRIVIRDATDGRDLLSLDNVGLCLSLDYHDATRRLAAGAGEGLVRLYEAFPWREDDYPGTTAMGLTRRIRLYADRYWAQRLVAEAEAARGTKGLSHQSVAPPELSGRPSGPASAVGSVPEEAERSAPAQPLPSPASAPGKRHQPLEIAFSWEPWLFPERDPDATPRQLDLGRFYTSPLTRKHYPVALWTQWADLDLRELPRGLVPFHDVEFDVRGVIQLQAREVQGQSQSYWACVPKAVCDLPAGQKCRLTHVLHGCVFSEGEGVVIGRYRFHYVDGTSQACNIVYGRDVRAFEGPPPSNLQADGPTRAQLVWVGSSPGARFLGVALRLYLATYENPRPDVEIAHLDFVSEMRAAAPFLVAMTLE
jgi:WD40 repeat protein